MSFFSLSLLSHLALVAQAATHRGQARPADGLLGEHGRKEGGDREAADGRGRVGEAGEDGIHVFFFVDAKRDATHARLLFFSISAP